MKLKYLIVALATCVTLDSSAGKASTDREVKKIIRKADKAFNKADFMNAFRLYGTALKKDPENTTALYKSGLCLFNVNKGDTAALKYFTATADKRSEAHYYLGRIYQLQGDAMHALQEFDHFKQVNTGEEVDKNELEVQVAKCETAIREEMEKDYYIVKNLGEAINSKYPDYTPLYWRDNLIFTSRRANPQHPQVDPYGKYYEDIYISAKNGDKWSDPQPITSLNTETHDACVAISPDESEMIIYRTDETKLSGDLYLTKFESAGWSTPVKMGKEVNSEYLEASACFSSNGNEIIFSSNRPGGYGGKDLYRIVRFLNGTYSLPANLGPAINTAEDEDAPFLGRGNNTLYFSSRGHGSMGEYDIFKAPYFAQEEKWKNVENMGRPLNSTNDDIYFFKTHDADRCFFTSRRQDGLGDADIYSVNFGESTRVIVYCRIDAGDIENEKLEDVTISLIDAATGTLEGLYNPRPGYRNIILLATKNKAYELVVEGENIAPVSRMVSFNNGKREIMVELKNKAP
jgi:hypothetical protein